MKVNDTCVGCEECLPYCTQGAIFMNEDQASIKREICVECGVCIDTDICPVSAFEEDNDDISEFKRPFGRLLLKHVAAKNVVQGSGFDVKTNDVAGNLPLDKIVVRFELNRPGGGLKFGDVEQMRTKMKQLGWNPGVNSRSRSISESGLTDKISDQRILTCHLELVLDPKTIPDVIRDVTGLVEAQNIWVSINMAGLNDTVSRTQEILKNEGIHMEPVAKINLGLGREL